MFNNEVRLIGWLEITDILQQEQGADVLPVLRGYVYTDKAYLGGKHPVLLKGKPASIVIEAARHAGDDTVQVFVIGRLRSPTTPHGSSCVVAHYVKMLDSNRSSSRDVMRLLADADLP
ncbi:hypothetical protein D6779_06570 [Candidatus Parcubacteria bacterium]|nr:MAG: hypothetical protein D6779_06570 [Candidatus Parcubacteria bacterium]